MVQNKKLKILLVSSEMAPLAKSGGLGDVVGSLPKALRNFEVDIRVVLPKYNTIKVEYLKDVDYLGSFVTTLGWRRQEAKILRKNDDFPIYLVENDFYFGRGGLYGYADDNERFGFFSKAVLDMLALIDFYPDIIHCNDWQTGPLCLYLKGVYHKILYYSKIKTLFTIHNLQYQGNFDIGTLEMLDVPCECFRNRSVEYGGQVNYMKMGLVYADWISTVSQTYAKEIRTGDYGYGLDDILRNREKSLSGILNGIDYGINDPKTDTRIYQNFDIDTLSQKKGNKNALQKQLGLQQMDAPLVGMITRLVEQKGLDILSSCFDEMMHMGIQVALLGTGEGEYENFFRAMADRYPGRVSANVLFDDTLAQRIYAGSDFFLMPSLFEPCGLGQMFALRYGTIPIVRKTGGLADTVSHYDTETKMGNGFVFETYDKGGILWAMGKALEVYHGQPSTWTKLIRNAMETGLSWEKSAKEYIRLYRKILAE